MGIFNWFSKPTKESVTKDKEYYSKLCSVEFYPASNVYFAKYRDRYLDTEYLTNIVKTLEPHLYYYADKFTNEKDAWVTIDKFIEQKFKVNVVTITR